MFDSRKVVACIYSDKNRKDIESTVSMFTGISSSGSSINVNIISKYECGDGWDQDYAMVIDAFRRFPEDNFIIICKDTAISSSSSRTILNLIEKVIGGHLACNEQYFDIFYFCKWMDRCDQFSNYRDGGDHGLKIVDTTSPNGIECMMFSPEGRNKFMREFDPGTHPLKDQRLGLALNTKITDRNSPSLQDSNVCRFVAQTCHPNIIQFDITKRRNDNELVKTTECRDIPVCKPEREKCSGGLGVFWFIVIILIVAVLAYVVLRLGRKFYGVSNPEYATLPT
jgi:hypothetical protein